MIHSLLRAKGEATEDEMSKEVPRAPRTANLNAPVFARSDSDEAIPKIG